MKEVVLAKSFIPAAFFSFSVNRFFSASISPWVRLMKEFISALCSIRYRTPAWARALTLQGREYRVSVSIMFFDAMMKPIRKPEILKIFDMEFKMITFDKPRPIILSLSPEVTKGR
jgi:hypothetical protein